MPTARNKPRRTAGANKQVARPQSVPDLAPSEAITTTEVDMPQYLDGYFALMQRKHQERDQAYADGYSAGWADGFEEGLRTLLSDATIALGR
jgi:hypothetical protein